MKYNSADEGEGNEAVHQVGNTVKSVQDGGRIEGNSASMERLLRSRQRGTKAKWKLFNGEGIFLSDNGKELISIADRKYAG
jgi:hypothetical protein